MSGERRRTTRSLRHVNGGHQQGETTTTRAPTRQPQARTRSTQAGEPTSTKKGKEKRDSGKGCARRRVQRGERLHTRRTWTVKRQGGRREDKKSGGLTETRARAHTDADARRIDTHTQREGDEKRKRKKEWRSKAKVYTPTVNQKSKQPKKEKVRKSRVEKERLTLCECAPNAGRAHDSGRGSQRARW